MDYGILFAAVIVLIVAFLWTRARGSVSDSAGTDKHTSVLEDSLREEKEKSQKLQDSLSKAEQENARLQAEKSAAEQRIAEQKNNVAQMNTQFENLANKIFEEKSKSFSERSQKDISNLLNPLKEQFQKFQTKVDDSFGKQAKEQFALTEEIKRVVEVHQSMSAQTQGLTDALKRDSKTQGNWGEVMLEKILEDSGLRKGQDYIVQGAGFGLTHAETGKGQRPDVIVKLPENKHVIIDSKLSLTHYERFNTAEAEADKTTALKQFIASVRKHVDDLHKSGYADNDTLGMPDFVLMFMPIEGSYSLAVQTDTDLHRYAWDKKIVIVCPSTLFATLKTIASIWRLELQNKNAVEIARQGGALYDKVVGFVKDMENIEKYLDRTKDAYGQAINKLSKGRGNILGKTEALRTLGAKTAKNMPTGLLNEDEDENEDASESENESPADESVGGEPPT